MHKKIFTFAGIGCIRGILCFCGILFFSLAQGVIDNRFRDPALNHQVFITHDTDTQTVCIIQPFVETAHHSFDVFGKKSGLYDIGPLYSITAINNALLATKRIDQSLIPTYWTNLLTNGIYNMRGRLQTQGVAFHVYHEISNHWAFGIRGEGLHENSRMELVRDATFDGGLELTDGNLHELTLLQEKIDTALGLNPPLWNDWLLGDLELYVRLFNHARYAYKCRFIDAGLALGIIVPAAPARNINNPAALPMGGDRHWGIYVEGSFDAIVRHDIRAGFLLRYQQRFSRTSTLRVPTGNEPINFGAIVGDISVSPGLTLMFAPYLIKENLRDGFGMRLGYTGVKHFKDTFSDRRVNPKAPINYGVLCANSEWGLDYVTLGFLYDFAYDKVERNVEPVVSLLVDVPVDFLWSSRAAQTYGIALAVETSF